MKQSKRFIGVRRQLVLRISALVVVILAMFWLFNTLFMSYFYREEKVEAMEKVFEELDYASVTGRLYEGSFESKFEQISLNNNLDIVVMSYDGSVLLSSGKEKRNTVRRLLDAVLSNTDGTKSIVHTSMYDITYNKDLFVNEEYLILTGTLSDGKLIMIRYAIENMKFSLDVINKTTIVVALIAFLLALLLSELLARRITKPIVELTDISKRMSELDFYKYIEKTIEKNQAIVVSNSYFLMREDYKTLRNATADSIHKECGLEGLKRYVENIMNHLLHIP